MTFLSLPHLPVSLIIQSPSSPSSPSLPHHPVSLITQSPSSPSLPHLPVSRCIPSLSPHNRSPGVCAPPMNSLLVARIGRETVLESESSDLIVNGLVDELRSMELFVCAVFWLDWLGGVLGMLASWRCVGLCSWTCLLYGINSSTLVPSVRVP